MNIVLHSADQILQIYNFTKCTNFKTQIFIQNCLFTVTIDKFYIILEIFGSKYWLQKRIEKMPETWNIKLA